VIYPPISSSDLFPSSPYLVSPHAIPSPPPPPRVTQRRPRAGAGTNGRRRLPPAGFLRPPPPVRPPTRRPHPAVLRTPTIRCLSPSPPGSHRHGCASQARAPLHVRWVRLADSACQPRCSQPSSLHHAAQRAQERLVPAPPTVEYPAVTPCDPVITSGKRALKPDYRACMSGNHARRSYWAISSGNHARQSRPAITPA
jgi:hypothetical protein